MSDTAIRRSGQLLLAGLLGTLVWTASTSPFVLDEWEHVHAAWKLAHGEVLYIDFFEHHHPPIYLLLAPLTAWWPESMTLLHAARGVQMVLVLGCLGLVGAVAREFYDRPTAWWAAGLWLGFAPVLVSASRVRPDTAMTFFLFLAAWWGLRAGPAGRARWPTARRSSGGGRLERGLPTGPGASGPSAPWPWIAAGASWAVALLFSSKAIFFLPVMALLAVLAAGERSGGAGAPDGGSASRATATAGAWSGWRSAARASASMTVGAAGPVGVGLLALWLTGTAGAFWAWCVRFNFSFLTIDLPGGSPVPALLTVHEEPVARALIAGSGLAVALAVVGLFQVTRSRSRAQRLLLLGGTALPGLCLWLGGRDLYWDLLPALLFPAILAAHAVTRACRGLGGRRRRSPRIGPLPAWGVAIALAALLIAQPQLWQARRAGQDAGRDRARFEYVRDHTTADEPVHQEWPLFNLYRRDAGYFWFAAPAFSRRAAHLELAPPHDLRRLVERARPAYVTVLDRRRHHRWLTEVAGYRWLPELDLYERVDG